MIHSAAQYTQATRNSGIVVVRCTAEWCAPCKQIAEPYSKLVMEGVRFYTIDVERVDDFSDAGAVKKLPCFFIFKDGGAVGMVIGANLQNLINEIEKLQ